jgi:drug/metabolite transporter (DMT)-like permease
VYFVLLLHSLSASGTHLVAKVVVNSVDALTLTLIRSLIAVGGLSVVLLVRGKVPRVKRQDWGLVILLSMLAVPVNQFLFLYGMKYTTPANAALLYATTPILVLLFSYQFLAERLSGKKIYGVVLAFVGVTLVVFEHGLDAGMQYVFGNLVMSLAVVAWGLYTVYGKRLIAKYGPIEATILTLSIGTLMFIPIGIFPALQFPYESLSTANWFQIGYLGLITSVIAYLLWYYALARIEASKVALFANLQPILTAVLAFFLLGQHISGMFVIGGSLAICGVVLAQFG